MRFWAAARSGSTGLRERFDSQRRRDWLREIPRQTEPAEPLPGHVPMLVTFDDITWPEPVRQVDPTDLVASFGPDVSLTSAALKTTREPVTEGRVEAVLGWLPSIWPNKPEGRRYSTIEAPDRHANSLSAGSFSTEIRK